MLVSRSDGSWCLDPAVGVLVDIVFNLIREQLRTTPATGSVAGQAMLRSGADTHCRGDNAGHWQRFRRMLHFGDCPAARTITLMAVGPRPGHRRPEPYGPNGWRYRQRRLLTPTTGRVPQPDAPAALAAPLAGRAGPAAVINAAASSRSCGSAAEFRRP